MRYLQVVGYFNAEQVRTLAQRAADHLVDRWEASGRTSSAPRELLAMLRAPDGYDPTFITRAVDAHPSAGHQDLEIMLRAIRDLGIACMNDDIGDGLRCATAGQLSHMVSGGLYPELLADVAAITTATPAQQALWLDMFEDWTGTAAELDETVTRLTA